MAEQEDPVQAVEKTRVDLVKNLRFIRAALGMEGVRAVLEEAGCLTPLFDEFTNGVLAYRDRSEDSPPGGEEPDVLR